MFFLGGRQMARNQPTNHQGFPVCARLPHSGPSCLLGNKGLREGAGRQAIAILLLGMAIRVACSQAAHGQELQPTLARTQNPIVPAPSLVSPSSQAGAADVGDVARVPYTPGLSLEPDCFANAEIAIVFPHLSSFLNAPVSLGENGLITTVALRNASLDATVSPLFQIGAFRFGPGYGELAISYHFLVTDGKDFFPAFGELGPALIRSRLNLQTISLDYIRNDCPVGWDTLLSWEAGPRLQVVFFDTQAQTAASFEQARNYFFGAGFHAGCSLNKALPSGIGLFGRFDAAMLGGYNTTQNFVVGARNPPNGVLSGSADREQSQFAPSLAVQAGLSWTPTRLPCLRLRGGYQFEQWYNVGRVFNSRGDLNAQGLFLSCEVSH